MKSLFSPPSANLNSPVSVPMETGTPGRGTQSPAPVKNKKQAKGVKRAKGPSGVISELLKKSLFRKRKRGARRRKRVVVTGIGVVSPIGIGLENFWDNLMAGKSGVDEISLFDASTYPCHLAAEVRDFNPSDYLNDMQVMHFSRPSQFACASARMALEDAGLNYTDPHRTDVIIGSAMSYFQGFEEQIRSLAQDTSFRPNTIDPMTSLKGFIAAPACAVALLVESRGYVTTVSSACSSGLNAVGLGAERIRHGQADIAVVGGVDTPISPYILGEFCQAEFVTTANDPSALCPFDLRRTRSVLGEGSGLFILEDLDHAVARGAEIYGEIVNYVQETENINELYFADSTGDKWSRTMKNALRKLKNLYNLDHINAHGPSDTYIDRAETDAIKNALGKRAYSVPISSIKGAVGSGFASAGAFQAAAAAMTLKTGRVPPIFNYEVPDPGCDLNYTSRRAEATNPGKVDNVLVNAHAMGGFNSALLLKRFSL